MEGVLLILQIFEELMEEIEVEKIEKIYCVVEVDRKRLLFQNLFDIDARSIKIF